MLKCLQFLLAQKFPEGKDHAFLITALSMMSIT